MLNVQVLEKEMCSGKRLMFVWPKALGFVVAFVWVNGTRRQAVLEDEGTEKLHLPSSRRLMAALGS